MTTKKQIALEYLPTDHFVSVEELASLIAKGEGIHYSMDELKTTLEFLRRRDNAVENKKRPGKGNESYRKKRTRKPKLALAPKPRELSEEEAVTDKAHILETIDVITGMMIDAAARFEELKGQIDDMECADAKELESLRAFKLKFKELFND